MNAIEKVKAWIAGRSFFSRQQLTSMDALENRPLMEAWIIYCKAWAQYRVWGKQETPLKAFINWHDAVTTMYGSDVEIEMTSEGCKLSNGQFYHYPKVD